MKIIKTIAKVELQNLFYSPIAWLILIIFTFQSGLTFVDAFQQQLDRKSLGYTLFPLTGDIYGYSLFSNVQNYLFLYMPLLTMGLMSRELSSGSVKLLYSSPITSTQIILGKYLAMMVYALLLIGILSLYVIWGVFTIKSLDIPPVLVGLFGLYALICTYSAIGLFMSCLSSYQMVAGIGTLALLTLLNYMGQVGQDIDFFRDLTYWLSIAGRANSMLNGILESSNILYFILVTAMFLMLSILKIDSGRKSNSFLQSASQYASIVVGAVFLGYLTSRPFAMRYYDATATKINTLSVASQQVMKHLKGDVTLTTYVNLLAPNYETALPAYVNQDKERFKHYVRFAPQLDMKYVYYYDKAQNSSLDQSFPTLNDEERAKKIATVSNINFDRVLSPKEIKKQVDLSGEENRFVRLIETENGKKTFIRIFNDMEVHPSEKEITAAFKRVVMDLPKIAFLKDHGERTINSDLNKQFSLFASKTSYRDALINQGFDVASISIANNQPIPADVAILVIADPGQPFTEQELQKLDEYIAKGGNLLIAGEPGRQPILNPVLKRLGVELLPGTLVQPSGENLPTLITPYFDKLTEKLDSAYYFLRKDSARIPMSGAAALAYSKASDYIILPYLNSPEKGSWIKVAHANFMEDSIQINPGLGEREQSHPTALTLERKTKGKDQRIVVLGDADCLSNLELTSPLKGVYKANTAMISLLMKWLSYGELPIDTTRPNPLDNDVFFAPNLMFIPKAIYLGILPMALLITALAIWIVRKSR